MARQLTFEQQRNAKRLKRWAVLATLVTINLVLVLSLRAPGVMVATLLGFVLYRYTPAYDHIEIPDRKLWSYGQFIVPGLVFLVCLPFSGLLAGAPVLGYLADLNFIHLPIDRVILAMFTDATGFQDVRDEISRPVFLQGLFRWAYPAFFVAAYVALLWFCIALPKVFAVRRTYVEDGLKPGSVKVRLVAAAALLGLIFSFLHFDVLYFHPMLIKANVSPLLVPHGMLFILLELIVLCAERGRFGRAIRFSQ